MIKANLDNGEIHLTASGSVETLIKQSAEIVAGLYAQLKVSCPVEAEAYRKGVTLVINHPNTPIWKQAPADNGIAITIPMKGGEQNG